MTFIPAISSAPINSQALKECAGAETAPEITNKEAYLPAINPPITCGDVKNEPVDEDLLAALDDSIENLMLSKEQASDCGSVRNTLSAASFYGIFDNFEEIAASGLLCEGVDKLLASALEDIDNYWENTWWRFSKSLAANVVIQKLYEDYGLELSADQFENLALLYFKTYYIPTPEGCSVYTLRDIDVLFMLIANRHFDLFKERSASIAKKLYPSPMLAIPRMIFKEHMVATASDVYIQNPEDTIGQMLPLDIKVRMKAILPVVEQIHRNLDLLKTNNHTYHLASISMRGKWGGEAQTGRFQFGILPDPEFEEFGEYFFLEDELEFTSHQEMVSSIMLHEYAHGGLQNVDHTGILATTWSLSEITNGCDPENYLTDYPPEGFSSGPICYGKDKETGAMYVQAVIENSQAALDIALERASLGNYIPLAWVLLTLGALSSEPDSILFFKSTTGPNGKVKITTEKALKSDLLGMISPEYLDAIEAVGFVPENLLDSGLFTFNTPETAAESPLAELADDKSVFSLFELTDSKYLNSPF